MINQNLTNEQLDEIIKNVLHSEVEHLKMPERIKDRLQKEIIDNIKNRTTAN